MDYPKLETALLKDVDDHFYYGANCRSCLHTSRLSLSKLRAQLGGNYRQFAAGFSGQGFEPEHSVEHRLFVCRQVRRSGAETARGDEASYGRRQLALVEWYFQCANAF
jgi:hypothetical protein